MSEPRLVAVVLPVPVNRPYIYAVPDALAERAVAGARVLVPVRGRKAVGIVTEAVSRQPSARISIKTILAAPDEQPALSPALLDLGRWISDYYGAPLGLSLRAILPGPLWSVAKPAGPAPATERLFVLAPNGGLDSLLERESTFKRAPKRRAAYETVEALGGSAPVSHLVNQLKLSPSVLLGLVRQGLARFDHVPEMRDPFAGLSSPPPPSLTEDQRRVVQGILATDLHQPALIHGVTGSGKTLVYLDVLRTVVASGNGAILLVPEISLTPQTVARVRGVFGDQVAVLHSGLSDGERADAWRALRSGERRVAVGPRSAVFAPVQRLGAIVVDEEHEPSYKQGSAPRYHTRDVAAMRAQIEGARLLLGSATPSLETLTDAALVTFALPNRIGARPLPAVEIVDLRHAARLAPAESGRAIPWSEALDQAVAGALERGEQVILLLNRRGFATFVQCPACGNVPGCPQCAIALTLHQTPPALRCHYCGHEQSVPEICVICGHPTQRYRGLGTQQLEHFVGLRYPSARIARMDLDTTTSKWAHHHILERVGRGEVDILLGTQMIAKGLDFPNVTVVGVVDADTGLHFPDFRAGERTFQLVAQVAGRAGRGPKGGRVFVQTRAPDHHAIRAAAAHSVGQFAAAELPLRSPPNPSYPPRIGLARFVVATDDHGRTADLAEKVASWLRRASAERLDGALTVLGPAPCPIMRLKGKWRWHVLAKSAEARVLGRVVRAWRAKAHREVIVDRDPVSLL